MTRTTERVGAALPAYEVGAEIGRGACGVVLAGMHRRLQRPVAIKVLAEQFVDAPGVRSRFVHEARVLAGFEHPHIVPVYDYVEDVQLCALVMERLSGGTVWHRFRTAGLSQQASVAIVLAAASSLDYAHGRGVLHRDIKPENLLFSAHDVVKVTDFGIAKVLGAEMTFATRVGDTIGTPAYMAPEQAKGEEVTPSTDVCALGTVLYELLCGELPIPAGATAVSTLYRRVHEDPRPITEVSAMVPTPVAEVVMRAVAREPDRRTPTAAVFAAELAAAAGQAWGPGWASARGTAVAAEGVPVAPVTGGGAATVRVPGAGVPQRPAADLDATIAMSASAPAAPVTGGVAAGQAAGASARRRVRLLLSGAIAGALLVAAVLVLALHGWGGGPAGGGGSPGASSSSFHSDASVLAGSTLRVSSATPCPALPAGWKNQNAVVYLTDPRNTATPDVTANYIPTQPDGSWSGALPIPDATAAADYLVRVTCVGDDSSGTNTYFSYSGRNPVTVGRAP